MRSRRLACVALLLTTACRSSPTTPTPTASSPAAGTWTGAVVRAGISEAMRFTLEASLATNDSAFLAGRFEVGAVTGSVAGTTAASRVSLLLTPFTTPPCAVVQPFPPGQYFLELTLDGSRLAGSATVTVCGGSEPATASFQR